MIDSGIASVFVKNLSFSYGEKLTLDDVSISIDKGDFVSIIGPNGCGKTTLLKNILGLLPKDKGQILINNEPLDRLNTSARAKRMAYVNQDLSINFDFTVYDIVSMGRHPYIGRFQVESSFDKKKIMEAMEVTNTLNFKDKSISELSGGERQRVYIARAIAQETDILFLDEPTSHLDVHHAIEVFKLLKDLNRKGKTVIIVIHDINLAARFSDRIAIMRDGRLIEFGATERIIREDLLEEVYQVKLKVSDDNPIGKLQVTFLDTYGEDRQKIEKNVHIISGGGSGYRDFKLIKDNFATVSCGVLNVGDSDYVSAVDYSFLIVAEKPYSPISSNAKKDNLLRIKDSDIVILYNAPVSDGNLSNLEAVMYALGLGKKVYVVGNFENIDFCDGKANSILKEIYGSNSKRISRIEEMIFELKDS